MAHSKKLRSIIKSRKELTSDELETINLYRKKEFGSNKDTKSESDQEYRSFKYFLIKAGGNILSFGMMRTTDIEFRQKIYSTLEFISVVSVKKREGYGSLLIEQMKKYAEGEGKH